MPPITKRYVLIALVSGLVWGVIARIIGGRMVPGIEYAMIAGPLIGLAIGLGFRWSYSLPMLARIPMALLSLYVSAVLFGLVIGVCDAARGFSMPELSGRNGAEVILQGVFGTLWGLTFGGFVLFFWPLSILNWYVLGKFGEGRNRAAE